MSAGVVTDAKYGTAASARPGCRLASGDADGRVAVWDVLSGAVTGALEDPLGAATGRRTEADRRTGVVALAWLRAAPALLGIALAGGMFVLWDPRGACGQQQPLRSED